MPDRRRHGAHEDRGAGRARQGIRIVAARLCWSAICRVMRLTRRGFRWLLNARDHVPGAAQLMESIVGFSARRKLPKWRGDIFEDYDAGPVGGPEVVLFADTFNRYFERENLQDAVTVLTRRRLSRACRQGAGAVAPALLRPHVSLGRRRHQSAGGNAAHARRALAVHRARRAGGRAGAKLHPRLPRRNSRPDGNAMRRRNWPSSR